MDVILLTQVPSLGNPGEIVAVKNGYARNYLIPKKLAIPASKSNVKQLEHQKRLIKAKHEKAKIEAEKLASKIEKFSCTIAKKAGEEDKLFGSVTAKDIEESLLKADIHVDRKKILLDEPIKKVGIYEVPIKLHPEVTVNLKLWVVKE
ncbi:MAG: 50S ribosomal protein L9 [Deltaproteobacteria bacterium]|nr:50S ribosomal protein L9 [Deltaproteobacteria bacterium]RLA91711.1 MAG: 50S ribosomal protein L9 [Deltaproteobacteria bacterium]